MKIFRIIFLTLTFVLVSLSLHSQVKIIFDTDIGGDADDLGALAMLHNFIDQGECDLLAIICWSTEQYAVPAIDAINRFYKHPDIPIGARKDDTFYEEWNFNGGMAGVTQFVISNIPVPITFAGFEVGIAIKTGEVINEIDHNTPLYVGFMHFSQNAPWIKEFFEGKILDNSTFDQTAVLYAVRNGTGTYWDKVTGGKCMPDEKGGNTWVEDNNSSQSYLKLLIDGEGMAGIIESIMLGQF